MRGKRSAAVLTLARRSHFYLEKFVTPAFRRRTEDQLRQAAYGSVLYSYFTTTAATARVDPGAIPDTRLIWTHNDEFKWFGDLAASTKSPPGRKVARYSERWLHLFFGSRLPDFVLLHVTEADRDGYLDLYPDHRYVVVPIGVDVPETNAGPLPPRQSPVRLTFVGSLGVRMNLDALNHFASRFYPTLREGLGPALEVRVAGSAPSRDVLALCERLGWSVHSDLTDAQMATVIETSTFTILPFDYATGAKLKLLKTMAHGVPFLATTRVSSQSQDCIDPSLISDEPNEWLERIRRILDDGISDSVRSRLRTAAQAHSWETSAKHLFDSLQRLP